MPGKIDSEVFSIPPDSGVAGLVLFFLAVGVIGPIAEECLFRGVLLPWLMTWMKPAAAISASALAFGLGHLHYGSGVLLAIAYGIILAWMRLRTGQLRSGIALHMLINIAGSVVILLKATG